MANQPIGAFVGLTTVDIVYSIEGPPRQNTKNVVSEVGIFAGGPAANAAVTFAALGGRALLTTAIGKHPLGAIALRDLQDHGVDVIDLIPQFDGLPSLSSVIVSIPGGDRTVVSTAGNALPELPFEPDALAGEPAEVMMVDGHLPRLSSAAARQAKQVGIPVVLDAGTWKDELGRCLPATDYAICGEEFSPPGCESAAEIFDYLADMGVSHSAITRGERSILIPGGKVAVDPIGAVDTLGAGDIFHGAFCYSLAAGEAFEQALRSAASVARLSCESFGTRAWIAALEPRPVGAVKKTYCRVGARERQAHAKLSAAERRPCRNRNFCASTPD